MKKAFLQLHIAVLLAGLTGILGKLIHLNEGLLVWYRLLITSITLWIIFVLQKRRAYLPLKEILKVAGVGAIAALHWVGFYGSIKYSNVSVGLLCFSAVGFFTALLEPLMFRVKMDFRELMLGMMVIAGIYFIFHFDPHYKTGIIIGLFSALLGSIFPILNKRLLERVEVNKMIAYQLTGGFLFLTLLLPFYLKMFPGGNFLPTSQDWIWLLVLSWLCTVLAFNLSMNALRMVSAFTVNLAYNLEPVYGIFLAFVVLGENRYFNRGFYIGFGMILLAIFLHMIILWKKKT